MMRKTFLLLSLFLVQILNAQNDWRVYDGQLNDSSDVIQSVENSIPFDTLQEGSVLIYNDSRIDSLIIILDDNPSAIKGYRVEIFFGQRKEAERVKSAFLKHYSKWPIYIVWHQPNFKVQIGDFMTKLQAEKAQQEIKSQYPNSYIIITQIKVSEN